MKILEEKENNLLNRKEVKIIVEAAKNPSFQEAENWIAEKFKAEKELIVIKGIKGKFGRNTFLITSFIYKSKEAKEKLEKKKEKKQEESKEQIPTVQVEKKGEEKPKEDKQLLTKVGKTEIKEEKKEEVKKEA